MNNFLSTLKNHVRPIYWHLRFPLLNSKAIREYAVAGKLGDRLDGVACSVCASPEIFQITFVSRQQIDKCHCKRCQHIFSRKLNKNLQRASELFGYDTPNDQYEGQKRLQIELVKTRVVLNGKYLDFGVGGNIAISRDLRGRYPQHEFYSCDLYSSSDAHYFQIYSSASPLHSFDGISSNAVVEHLDNTLEAWTYLNRLLKPLSEGGGTMIHAFPSQLVEDPNHWTIKIASHECLFSKASLALICEQAGFALMKIRFFGSVQHPVYYFRKTADLNE